MVGQAGITGTAFAGGPNAAWTVLGMPRSDLTAQRSILLVDQSDLTGANVANDQGCVSLLYQDVIVRIKAALAQHRLLVVVQLCFFHNDSCLGVPPGQAAPGGTGLIAARSFPPSLVEKNENWQMEASAGGGDRIRTCCLRCATRYCIRMQLLPPDVRPRRTTTGAAMKFKTGSFESNEASGGLRGGD